MATRSTSEVSSIRLSGTPKKAARNSVWPGNVEVGRLDVLLVNRGRHDGVEQAGLEIGAGPLEREQRRPAAGFRVGWPGATGRSSSQHVIRLGFLKLQVARRSAPPETRWPRRRPARPSASNTSAWPYTMGVQRSSRRAIAEQLVDDFRPDAVGVADSQADAVLSQSRKWEKGWLADYPHTTSILGAWWEHTGSILRSIAGSIL